MLNLDSVDCDLTLTTLTPYNFPDHERNKKRKGLMDNLEDQPNTFLTTNLNADWCKLNKRKSSIDLSSVTTMSMTKNNTKVSSPSSSDSDLSTLTTNTTTTNPSCLHLYLSFSCPYCQTKPTKLTHKRKRVNQETHYSTIKNMKHLPCDIDVCLHLSLASSCFPSCTIIHDEDIDQKQHPFMKTKKFHQEPCDSAKEKNNPVGRNWKIKKVLTSSDAVGQQCRLLLNKELAKQFVVPFLDAAEAAQNDEGVNVQVFDVDTNSIHSLVFKIWTSTQGHVFKKTWSKDFVKRRGLKIGDEVAFNWDDENNRFNFSVIRRC